MSQPSLPTSEGDLIIPLPDQALIDSKLKHLRGQAYRRPHQRTPAGLVVDPINLLQCMSGSDTTYSVNSVTTYAHSKQVTVVSSSSASQGGISSSAEYQSHSSDSSQPIQHAADGKTKENKSSSVVEHFEVEPHARSVLAFRRNSMRQLSPLMEETGDKETSTFPPPTGGSQPGFTTPLFVISDGIRNTYFPGEPKSPKRQETGQSNIAQESTDSHVAVYEQIRNPKLIRRIQSHPELSSFGELDESFHDGSVSSFPKVKVTLKSEVVPGSMSIFSSIAGELRSHVRTAGKHEGSNQSNAVVLSEKKTVVQSKEKPQNVESTHSPGTSPRKSEVGDVHLLEDVPDGKLKKNSFVKSVFKWGTESKVKVSDKECNMYSPASF